MPYKKERGFTLTEMLIIIIIIGILAALALPQFDKTREHAIGKEAIANLKLIAAAERIYRMESTVYFPYPAGSESNITNINDFLRLSITETNWDYAVNSADSTASASRKSGSYEDCTYTLDFTADEPTTSDCP